MLQRDSHSGAKTQDEQLLMAKASMFVEALGSQMESSIGGSLAWLLFPIDVVLLEFLKVMWGSCVLSMTC